MSPKVFLQRNWAFTARFALSVTWGENIFLSQMQTGWRSKKRHNLAIFFELLRSFTIG